MTNPNPQVNQTITVSWSSAGGVTTTPSTIAVNQNTPVRVTWALGTGVNALNNVTTPSGSPGSLPAPTSANTVWSCLFNNSSYGAGAYTYTVTVYTTSNNTITTDPQIINDPLG